MTRGQLASVALHRRAVACTSSSDVVEGVHVIATVAFR
jgi:hypothetical protein